MYMDINIRHIIGFMYVNIAINIKHVFGYMSVHRHKH